MTDAWRMNNPHHGGVPQVLKFPFAYDTPGLVTGHPVYTPRIGDVLLDAWVEVQTAWDGTTPLGDLGTFSNGNWGLWSGDAVSKQIDMTQADIAYDAGLLNGATNNMSLAAASVGGANVGRQVPLRFNGADPLKFCVSQDGTNTGDNPGATQGAAVLYLLVATPA